MSCFGTGCRTRGASSAGITSAWPSRSRTDNERGMPPHPRWDGKRAAGEMCRGEGGDGDRIGGEWVGCPFEISKSGQSENMIYYLRSRELKTTVARG